MPWAGQTPGGAESPAWGAGVALHVWAKISSGPGLLWGPSSASTLSAGYMWGPSAGGTGAWVPLQCDVLDLQIHTGSDDVTPFANVAEAGTCEITLRDPNRFYDPVNPDSPYTLNGVTRLTEGTEIWVFAETLGTDDATTLWDLFKGTVDTWVSDWLPRPADRQARVVATDCTKLLQGLDWGEQASVGNGDYQVARIQRILARYGWTGATVLDHALTRYQATTLAQSAWELLGEVMTDSNGFLYVDSSNRICTAQAARWTAINPTLTIAVGCGPDIENAYDVVLDVEVATSEIQNSVSASRTGGTMSTYRDAASVALYGERGAPKRTDLTLYDDTYVKAYADSIFATRAMPKGRLTSVTIRPGLDPRCWASVFRSQQYLAKERVRVAWQPPDYPESMYEARGRPFGVTHSITRRAWDVKWALGLADVYGKVLHTGPHKFDKLDSGNVLI